MERDFQTGKWGEKIIAAGRYKYLCVGVCPHVHMCPLRLWQAGYKCPQGRNTLFWKGDRRLGADGCAALR